MTELLTGSRLRSFRTCARLHQYQYVERWRPSQEPEYFRVGTLIHTGLESWWQAVNTGGDRLAFALASVAGLAIDAFEQAKVEEMLLGYECVWGVTAADYEVLGVEQSFDAPLLNPKTWRESQTWRLAGKIDAIVRRKSDGHVLVVEHKTCGAEIDGEDAHYWQTLALDHQISGYVIGAEALGHKVVEILYDVLRKPAQRPLLATPEEARKYTKDGRLYAAQRDRDEIPEEYRARVHEAIHENLSRYYQRRAIPRTQSQIADYLADAWQQGRAMRDLELEGFAPRNPDACFRFGSCPMWVCCSTGTHPSDHPATFVQIEDANPELGRETK